MAAGQAAFSVAADVAALDAVCVELAVQELSRGALHVRQLRAVLRLEALGRAAGMELSTVPQVALALGCSELRASGLLSDALLLGELPGGLEAVECGLLSVEQSRVVVEQLTPLSPPARVAVWRRLQSLLTDEARWSVLPPARLTELLRGWVVEVDRDAAEQRRKQAEQDRRVDYRRRADGLGDLFAYGFTGTDLQAVLSRVRARSAPVGPADERTADQRRFDALKDLLLGRDPLPLDAREGDGHDRGGGRSCCGCWPGAPVPCGAELLVHVPIGAAVGTTDEVAELVGHGPLEPDLLEALLLAAPRLRVVWTDAEGVPVAVGDRVRVPERGDPRSVSRVLDELCRVPPDVLHPRHPYDHPPQRAGARQPAPPLGAPVPPGPAQVDAGHGVQPADQPGPYRLPRRLRRLIAARSPRCEWPGCGARAVRCDAEHDQAWPDGPTCACNLGPCCRRHHRIKQLGWTKTRHSGSSVTWTSPAGRPWHSRAQHQPPQPPVRGRRVAQEADPFDELGPGALEDELWWLGLLPEDPGSDTGPREARDVQERDVLHAHLTAGDTRWTLDLDDPYRWLPSAS